MATFRPNPPIAGFSVNTGSFEGPRILVDELTNTTVPTFLIGGNAVGSEFFISSSNFNVKANGNVTASNLTLTGGIIQTSTDTNKSRIIIDGFSDPATMTFYSASDSQFTLSSDITYFAPDTPSKSTIAYTATCPARSYISTGKGGLVLTNGMIFQGSSVGNLQIQEGGIKIVAGDQQTYTLDITRQIDCTTGIDGNYSTGTGNFIYYNKYTLNGNSQFRSAVRAVSYNGWSGSLGTYVGVYSDASTNNTSRTAYSFYGAGGYLYNASSVGIGTTAFTYQLQLSTDSAGKPSTNTWTISSDERLKTNIQEANYDTCYDIVKQLPLKRYTWKDEVYNTDQVKDRSKLGWIAQDVEVTFPKAVESHSFSGSGDFYLEDCRSLNADQIYAALYGAVKKLIIENEQLKLRISVLESGSI